MVHNYTRAIPNRRHLLVISWVAAIPMLVLGCGEDSTTFGETTGAPSTSSAGGGGAGGAAGGMGGASGGGGAGGGQPCDSVDDCPTESCQIAECTPSGCVYEPADAGEPCEDGGTVCDGQGSCVECLDDGHCDAGVCDDNSCVPATCTDMVLNGDETDVDCGGSCNGCENGESCLSYDDCQSQFCDGGGSGGAGGVALGACAACTGEADCSEAPDTWCDPDTDGGSCVDEKMGGASCTDGVECLSGFCPADDGVCCDTACSGTCEACLMSKTGVADGTCALVTGGTDPDGECADQGPASCGPDGSGCSGTSASCNLYDQGTVCAPASCDPIANEEVAQSECDGSGSCIQGMTASCSPYVCDGSQTACLTDCTGGGDADCVSGYYCDGTSCVPLEPNGTSCTGDNQCQSGFCVDGVCCDSACGGICEACDLSGSEGTCTDHAAGTDPDDDCSGADVCNGSGSCQCNDGTLNGDETDVDCGGGTCPQCSLGDTCQSGSDCSSGFCVDGVCCDAACGGTCEACDLSGSVGSCSPYAAGTDPEDECSDGDVCNGSGACQCNDGTLNGNETDVDCGGGTCPQCSLGDTCQSGTDCASGFCVDGVCCDSACGGTCEACDIAGSEGTCSPYQAGTDPEDECPSGSACDGSGSCSTLSCGTDAAAPGGSCPAVCTGGCQGVNNETCTILCDDADECKGASLSCPAGFDCSVQCSGANGCDGASVTCPDDHSCSVSCTGTESCKNATVDCSANGLCDLGCGLATNTCDGTTLNCGSNQCTATCQTTPYPTVNCGSSCSCQTTSCM